MRFRRYAAVASLLVLSATWWGGRPASAGEVCDQSGISFAEPVKLGTGAGYEPGIQIDSVGTIYATAHKLSVVREEGTRLASYLWRSTDGGATFHNLTADIPITAMYALEGDLAVDGKDRLYFVDTWAADNHISRWSNRGSKLDFVRPAVASAEVDDRPWLAAHGDGYVYYLSNTGYGPTGRLTVHRSTDGGESFDPIGHTLEKSGWGFIDADPNSSYVYAVYHDQFYGTGLLGRAKSVWVEVSPDRGATWQRVKIADYEFGADVTADHDDAYPTVSVAPDGSIWALWGDDGRKLMLAHSQDHGETWDVRDVTPFEGVFSYSWMSVAPNGDVGISFIADPAAEEVGVNYVYGMLYRPDASCLQVAGDEESACSGPATAFARLEPRSPGGYASQADFFQNDFAPDNRLHVTWTGRQNKITATRQSFGPNLAGTDWCGV
ncbi:MAG TPA: sialidase family protein, partial [Actinomycetota bacterium]|nr:sialidase family protein [Actinomycetota bacterium]